MLLDYSKVRIGQKKMKNHRYTKSVATLVDSENWSKKTIIKKNNHALTKSVARLVESLLSRLIN